MNKEQFTSLLKSAGLSKKAFAEIANISYNTANNWNDDTKPIPQWVEPFLNLYIENKECRNLKQILKEALKDQ